VTVVDVNKSGEEKIVVVGADGVVVDGVTVVLVVPVDDDVMEKIIDPAMLCQTQIVTSMTIQPSMYLS